MSSNSEDETSIANCEDDPVKRKIFDVKKLNQQQKEILRIAKYEKDTTQKL
jgi:hypothetical protein